MRKNIKYFIATVLMLAAAVFALTACGGNGVTEISVTKSAALQTVYVLGNELDLSKGTLTLKRKDGSEQIPLNSDGITVTGYDKNKLGKQELTIEYEGFTTKLTVEVVPRILALNADYFTGEPFEFGRGSFTITNDDGTSFSVGMSDKNLTVSGFDSSKAAAPLPVTIQYTRNGVEYSGSANVNIYDVESVDFDPPTKTNYLSHEPAVLDLTGCYLTLSGNGGKLTRYINIDESMATGFDISAATEANMETPYVQKITIDYVGHKYTFDINITFSAISLIRQKAESLKSLDWSKGIPQITEEQGQMALDTYNEYLEIPLDDKALIPRDDYLTLGRVAAVYGFSLWQEEVKVFHFSIKNHVLSVYYDDYATADSDYQHLKNPENPIYSHAQTLYIISTRYENESLYGETTFGEYLHTVCPSPKLSELAKRLNVMLSLYDALEVVPSGWTRQNLGSYKSEIEKGYEILKTGALRESGDRRYYEMATKWRADNDLFDILYGYYYNEYVGIDDKDSDDAKVVASTLSALRRFYMPGLLEELYLGLNIAKEEVAGLKSGKIIDTTLMVYYTEYASRLSSRILSSETELRKELYEHFAFAKTLDDIITGEKGYQEFRELLFDDKEFNDLWTRYLEVVGKYGISNTYSQNEFAKDISSLFEFFVKMPSMNQVYFLRAVNINYSGRDIAESSALDLTKGGSSMFTQFLADYYGSVLSENAFKVFQKSLTALEYLMHRFMNAAMEGTENTDNKILFWSTMEEVTADYLALSPTERTAFTNHVSKLYNLISRVYQRMLTNTSVNLGTWQDKVNELTLAVRAINDIRGYRSRGILYKQAYGFDNGALLAAFLYAEDLYNDIVYNAPDEVVDYVSNETFNLLGMGPMTIDYAFKYMRGNFFTDIIKDQKVEGVNLLDVYLNTEIGEFYSKAYHAMRNGMISYLFSLYEEKGDTVGLESLAYSFPTDVTCERDNEGNIISSVLTLTYNADKVRAATDFFREMDLTAQWMFLKLDLFGFYYSGISGFFEDFSASGMTLNAREAAKALLDLEKAYVFYKYSAEAEEAEELYTALQDALSELNSIRLTTTEREQFNTHMGDMYKYYTDACKDI